MPYKIGVYGKFRAFDRLWSIVLLFILHYCGVVFSGYLFHYPMVYGMFPSHTARLLQLTIVFCRDADLPWTFRTMPSVGCKHQWSWVLLANCHLLTVLPSHAMIRRNATSSGAAPWRGVTPAGVSGREGRPPTQLPCLTCIKTCFLKKKQQNVYMLVTGFLTRIHVVWLSTSFSFHSL